MRTPLNAILGFGQLLQMDVETPDLQESVGYILKAGEHLLNLINDVLEIARIEEGKLDISLEPVLVHDLLEESLQLVHPLAAQRNITVKADVASVGNCCVRADRRRLQQVLLNLISNGLKYNREGGGVTVSCNTPSCGVDGPDPGNAGGAETGERVRISVSDTGRGLSPEQVARLFTPFERVGAEQGEVEGTGLGLALSRHLVECMGGVMGVQSERGVGSTFWVELDAANLPMPVLELAITRPLNNIQLSEQVRTLLYIEDNLSNLRLVEVILKKQPWVKLISAGQGQMGLDMASEHLPDLVLLDLHLPDMPGSEVLRRLQSDPRTSLIPVVMLSADANPHSAAKLLEAGAHAYLTKPLDVKRLLKVLDATLAQKVG